jgi:hypothetical protein
MTMTSPWSQTRCSLPRRNSIFALEHPHDLLIWVTVRLDMDACPDGPPYDHPLVSGENAAADLFADLLLK